MAPSKKHSYVNLRRVLPQFSDDVVNDKANQRVITRHILQNNTFDPAIGQANYGNFSHRERL